MPDLKAREYRRFEDIKYVRKNGSEYWSARELADVLDYSQWRNFQKVIDRAMIACENSGHEVTYDFAEVSKIVRMLYSSSIGGSFFSFSFLSCSLPISAMLFSGVGRSSGIVPLFFMIASRTVCPTW